MNDTEKTQDNYDKYKVRWDARGRHKARVAFIMEAIRVASMWALWLYALGGSLFGTDGSVLHVSGVTILVLLIASPWQPPHALRPKGG